MVYQYSLSKPDYLHYMFYSTSKSRKVAKRRSLNKLLLMVMVLMTVYFLYSKNWPFASAVFFLLCIPLYFLYNTFERKQYLKHFNRFIDNHFTKYIDKSSTIELAETNFHVIDDEDQWHNYADIEEITDTSELLILQLKNGVAILLPKKKIDQSAELIETFKQKATQYQIAYVDQQSWKWK